MKKRANLITRVALAATIFVTALAGVTPMTAKAETKTSTFNVSGNATSEVNGNYTITFDYDETKLSFNAPSITAGDSIPTTELSDPTLLNGLDASKVYTVNGWYTEKSGGSKVTKVSDVATASNHTPTIFAQLTETDKTPTAPTISVKNGAQEVSNGGSVAPNTTVTVTITTDAITKSVSTKVTPAGGSAATYADKTFTTSITADTTIIATAVNGTASADSAAFTIKAVAPAEEDSITSFTADPKEFNKNDPKDIKFTYALTGSGNSVSVTGADTGFSSYFTAGSSSFTVDKEYFNRSNSTSVRITITDRSGNKEYIDIPITTGATTTGTEAKLKSFSWNTSSGTNGNIDLGTISIVPDNYYTDTTPGVLVLPVSDRHYDNGTQYSYMSSEIQRAKDLSVTLTVDGKEKKFNINGDVKWDFDYEGVAKDLFKENRYNRNDTNEQDFVVYSEPITLSDGTTTYVVSQKVNETTTWGPTSDIRLKLKVVVNSADNPTGSSSSGTNAPAKPVFSPANGTYVYPGAVITLTSTTNGATFLTGANNSNPPTSRTNYDTKTFADGASVKIPGGLTANTYKMNARSYSGSAYSEVESVTYNVATDNKKYSITEGNGQQASNAVPVTFTGSGDLSNFRALYIDGKFVPETFYTKQSGSTVVPVSPTYLQQYVTTSTPSVVLVYTDGYAEGSFTLTAGTTPPSGGPVNPINGNESGSNASGGGRANTPTDDRSELVIMFVLLGMLIAGFVVSVYYKNEKLRRNRYMD